jgi:branched-chain amino acid aminotransferase
MINCNGKLHASLSEGSEDVIQSLHTSFSVEEFLRIKKGKLLFWEIHYFRIIATLRRYRYFIPMKYTMSFLKDQISSLVSENLNKKEDGLIRFQFIKKEDETFFIVSSKSIDSFEKQTQKTYSLDLYKEEFILEGLFSNLSSVNSPIRIIAKSYANENGLDDCVLLNNQKKIVETLYGTLYILQGNELITSDLDSGCQDFALRTVFNEWISKSTKFNLVEQTINPFELQNSEELMMISLNQGFQFVTKYRKTTFDQKHLSQLFIDFINQID